MDIQTFTILGSVPTKKNNYRVAKHGGLYKPTEIKDFERYVSQEITAQKARSIEGPIEFSLTLIHGRNEPDLDGTITTVLDALQDAGLFENDRSVVRIHDCEKRSSTGDGDPERIIVMIGTAS